MYIGMIVWGLAYIFGPDKKYSDLTTLSFMAFDMLGIILSTMHIFKIANISNLIFFTAMNIIAGIIYVSLPSLVLAKQPKQST
jgi:hypothetical protein